MRVTHTIAAASLIGILLIPGAGLAQTPAPGALHQSIEREAVRLARTGGAAVGQQASPKRRSWPVEHPILFGALVGAGTGAAWGAAQCRTACEGGGLTPYIMGYGAGLFGGIGAGIGAVIAVARH